MKKSKKLLLCLLFLAVALFAYNLFQREFVDKRITLNIQSKTIKFEVGQSLGKLINSFESFGVSYESVSDSRYKPTEDLKYISSKSDGCEYIFVIFKGSLIRIEQRDYNGVGVILPKNYAY